MGSNSRASLWFWFAGTIFIGWLFIHGFRTQSPDEPYSVNGDESRTRMTHFDRTPDSVPLVRTPTTATPAEADTSLTNPEKVEAAILTDQHGRFLESRLQAHRRIRPSQARIGLGRIDPQDLADFLTEIEKEHGRDGAPSYAHLANVETWIEAPIRSDGAAGWRIGPIAVPEAELYRVLAWGDRGYFLGDEWVGAGSDPEPKRRLITTYQLIAQPFTGIEMSFNPEPNERYKLTLTRQSDPDWADETSQLADLIDFVHPALLAAYEGQPIALEGSPHKLWPLFPDPAVKLTFIDPGRQRSTALDVILDREQINRVEVDLADYFEEPVDRTLDLVGRLTFPNGQPVALARVRTRDRQRAVINVDERGEFRLTNISANRTTYFTVSVPPPEEGERPLSAERHRLFFDPVTMETGHEPYQWELPFGIIPLTDHACNRKRSQEATLCRSVYWIADFHLLPVQPGINAWPLITTSPSPTAGKS